MPNFTHTHSVFLILLKQPSGIGKTSLLTKILLNHEDVFGFKVSEIHIYYREPQSSYLEIISNSTIPVYLHREQPSCDTTHPPNSIVIFDDFQGDRCATQIINSYFLKSIHHQDLGAGIVLLQNLYDKDTSIRSINLNASLLLVFNNIRDSTVVNNLSRQIYPNSKNALSKVLTDITKHDSRGYIAINLHPGEKSNPIKHRLRNSVFYSTDKFPLSAIYTAPG